MSNKTYKLSWPNRSLLLGSRTCIMGVVNVTPDSFSDGGKFFERDTAVAHAEKLLKDGADIIDIGGESTRPFSDTVSADEEIKRVEPVIKKLAKRFSVPISIDTTKAAVARRALDAGACMINDISALRFDPKMADVALEYDVPVVLMHMLGSPKTMQISPHYKDVVGEIKAFFESVIDRAEKKGISRSKLIIDPGIGFGKTVEHNLVLIAQLDKMKTLDIPIMVGPSRKSFIQKILNNDNGKKIEPNLPALENGTHAASVVAVINGAHILRVHDVAGACAAAKVADALKAAGNGVNSPF